MRTHYRAFAYLSRYFHQYNIPKGIYSIAHFATKVCVFIMVVHALIVLLSRASPRHLPHPASCFPTLLIVCYLQLWNQALKWAKCVLLTEMRPRCGPFHQFSLHADQVRNCGPLWKHWFNPVKIVPSYVSPFFALQRPIHPRFPKVFLPQKVQTKGECFNNDKKIQTWSRLVGGTV